MIQIKIFRRQRFFDKAIKLIKIGIMRRGENA